MKQSIKMKNYKSGENTMGSFSSKKNIFNKVQIHSKDTLISWSQNGDINFGKQKKIIH